MCIFVGSRTRPLEDKTRVSRYIEVNSIKDDDLSNNTTCIVGEYVKGANAKYGAPDPSMYPLMISFLVQSHVVARTEVDLVKDMLGL